MRPLLTTLVFALLAGATLAACGGAGDPAHEFSGAVSNPPQVVSDFTLTDQHGEDFTLSADGAQVALVFFGYALCPDVCPTTLADLLQVKRALGADAAKVSFIWVTVDPERDTPHVLAQRLAVFDTGFAGLSGTREALEPVWNEFGVVAVRDDTQDTAAGYLISHSAYVYLVDQDRRIRVVFPFAADPLAVAADVAAILREGGAS